MLDEGVAGIEVSRRSVTLSSSTPPRSLILYRFDVSAVSETESRAPKLIVPLRDPTTPSFAAGYSAPGPREAMLGREFRPSGPEVADAYLSAP